ncbi:4Fe-4S binding protein [Methylopila sp. M107]|uniref:4Fe-4S binding protein n=1 Tax=Methylopila sp. M107 TaxID=1101190 RepID=UPI0003726516|nr:4Fe-4S binding protein [Methylopila sp. M107]
MKRLLRALALSSGLLLAGLIPALAGTLDRAGMERQFPPPLAVGEKDDVLPIWPILKQAAGSWEVVAYAFESIDFAPIPGFGGTPPDLLIALQPDGRFLEAKVLSHHEPVFLEGMGSAPLFAFVEQYVGLSARRAISVGRANARANGAPPATVVDGISMATASTRVINETMLTAALAVARAKLGFGAGRSSALRVDAKPDGFEPLSWAQLLEKGYVRRVTVLNRDVDKAFADTSVADSDPISAERPGEPFIDVYVAYLNVPSIGRNLLGQERFDRLANEIGPDAHALMLLTSGRWNALGEDFVLGSIPERIAVVQDGLAVNARDLAIERRGAGLAGMPDGPWTILKIVGEAGFDPSAPWTLSLKVERERGQILTERVAKEFDAAYALPDALFTKTRPDAGPSWVDSWTARWPELGLIGAALVLLVPTLARDRALVADASRFSWFRFGFLVFTLGFIGWYAQAQLSIVTIVGAVRAAFSTRDFSFLLYDPPSLALWAFAIATLVVWGRGTFCGWLCPFGALQELAAWAARPLHIRQRHVPPALDRILRKAKYLVLAGLVAAAATASPLVDPLAEIEPFKTSITLFFVRSWPFVVYAVGLIVLNLFVYKAFCRYLCPLGAALAIGGRLRLLDWIPRRAECGSPCQLCRVRCRYGAIDPAGKVDYAECFQCMDCVTIIRDPRQCVPEILAAKRPKVRLSTAEAAE